MPLEKTPAAGLPTEKYRLPPRVLRLRATRGRARFGRSTVRYRDICLQGGGFRRAEGGAFLKTLLREACHGQRAVALARANTRDSVRSFVPEEVLVVPDFPA